MNEKIEGLLKKLCVSDYYRPPEPVGACPDENTMACFCEEKLGKQEQAALVAHLASCEQCLEQFIVQLNIIHGSLEDVPADLLLKLESLIAEDKPPAFEIILRALGKTFKLIASSGDVLLGQEIMPVSVLRGRKINNFQDTVTILKDIDDIRVEIQINSKTPNKFNVTVKTKYKDSLKMIKDLRITLVKSGMELESYITGQSRVIFENVSLGKYNLEVSSQDNKMFSVLVDIRK